MKRFAILAGAGLALAQTPSSTYLAKRNELRAVAQTALDAELAREKAGDCPRCFYHPRAGRVLERGDAKRKPTMRHLRGRFAKYLGCLMLRRLERSRPTDQRVYR